MPTPRALRQVRPPENRPDTAAEPGADRGPTAGAAPEPEARLQRTTGTLRLAFKQGVTGTALDRLFQEGAARARLPRIFRGGPREAVLINTAGGLTGGDRFTTEVRVGDGAQAVVTTQASEKIYRASSGHTLIVNKVQVGAGACLEWLPQETIVFDGASLDRTLDVSVAEGGEAFLAEAVVLGRTAMGEIVRTGSFLDRWRVRRDGMLVYADGTAAKDDMQEAMGRSLALDGGCAFATLLWVSPTAEEMLAPFREAMEIGRTDPLEAPAAIGAATGLAGSQAEGSVSGATAAPARVGASAWDGLLAVRMAARDGASLRTALERALTTLRGGRDLPTVWQC